MCDSSQCLSIRSQTHRKFKFTKPSVPEQYDGDNVIYMGQLQALTHNRLGKYLTRASAEKPQSGCRVYSHNVLSNDKPLESRSSLYPCPQKSPCQSDPRTDPVSRRNDHKIHNERKVRLDTDRGVPAQRRSFPIGPAEYGGVIHEATHSEVTVL